MPHDLGTRVQALREHRGLTQAQFGDRLRAAGVTVSDGEVSRIETGRVRNPALAKVSALARVLGTSTDYLIDGRPADVTPAERAAQMAHVLEGDGRV